MTRGRTGFLRLLGRPFLQRKVVRGRPARPPCAAGLAVRFVAGRAPNAPGFSRHHRARRGANGNSSRAGRLELPALYTFFLLRNPQPSIQEPRPTRQRGFESARRKKITPAAQAPYKPPAVSARIPAAAARSGTPGRPRKWHRPRLTT